MGNLTNSVAMLAREIGALRRARVELRESLVTQTEARREAVSLLCAAFSRDRTNAGLVWQALSAKAPAAVAKVAAPAPVAKPKAPAAPKQAAPAAKPVPKEAPKPLAKKKVAVAAPPATEVKAAKPAAKPAAKAVKKAHKTR